MNKNSIIKLKKAIGAFGINLSQLQTEKFSEFADYILFWNRIAGLTAHRTENEIIDNMFADSVAFVLSKIDINNKKTCDFGTGGGFPGIPLKIIYPELDIVLIDSSTKKCDFLQKVCENLKLDKIDVICARGEDLCADRRYLKKFDIIFSRACATMNRLISLLYPMLSHSGSFVMWKGSGWLEEQKEALDILKEKNLEISSFYDYSLYKSEIVRTILVLSHCKHNLK